MASAQILTNGKALYAYNGTEWVPLNTTGNLVNSTRWQYTAVGSETSLSGNDDNGESLIYTPGYEQVYLNGVLLARDADYTATTGTTITGLTALTAGYIVEIIAYNNINVANTYTQGQIDNKIANTFTRWVKTLSASATTLSGLDDNAVTLDYTAGAEQVYVNGILLLPSEYTATSGSTVVLSEAAVSGDVIQVHTLKSFRIPNTYTITEADQRFIPDSIVDAKGDIITATADNTPARLALGTTDGQLLSVNSSTSTGLAWINPGLNPAAFLHIRDEKAASTQGGTFTNGAWRTRDLNTVKTNTITGASLSSNQITLPAGTYFIQGYPTSFRVEGNISRIYNITDSSQVSLGVNNHSGSSTTGSQGTSTVSCMVTITGTKVFELQHYSQSTVASVGFGIRNETGQGEVYSEILIWKVS
jgi:hypothetical protein